LSPQKILTHLNALDEENRILLVLYRVCDNVLISIFFSADKLFFSFNTNEKKGSAEKGNITLRTFPATNCVTLNIVKCKAIPLQAWTDREVSNRLRLPDFKTIGT
jgi:hypothetical protein